MAATAAGGELVTLLCLPCAPHPKKAITYTWFSSLALVAATMASACALADRHRGGGGAAFGFAAVWTSLLCVGLSAFGTNVLRRRPTPTAIGGLIGVVLVMANLLLMLTAVFGAESRRGDKRHKRESDVAFAVFSALLCGVYVLFASLLAVFRRDVISSKPPPDVPNHHHPGSSSSSSSSGGGGVSKHIGVGSGGASDDAAGAVVLGGGDSGFLVEASAGGGGGDKVVEADDWTDLGTTPNPFRDDAGDAPSSAAWHDSSANMFDEQPGSSSSGPYRGGDAVPVVAPLV